MKHKIIFYKKNISNSYKQINAERNSAFELLKVIAIIMIVISHSVPRYGDPDTTTGFVNFNIAAPGFQYIILLFQYYLGQLGNCIFIVCSAWFLVQRNMLSRFKIASIITDTVFVSYLWLFTTFLLGFSIDCKTIIKQLFPILFNNNWFIGCYIILYVIHPWLNSIIRSLSQKALFYTVTVMFLMYSVLGTLFAGKCYYYNELIGFIMIYFIVAYLQLFPLHVLKGYSNRKVTILVASFLALFGLVGLTNVLGIYLEWFTDKMLRWSTFCNPLIILIAITLASLLEKKSFLCKEINAVSAVSLLIYVIHENSLFREIIKPVWWSFIHDTFTFNYLSLWILIFAGICFTGSLVVALSYQKILKPHLVRISVKAIDLGIKIIDCLYNKISKL